MFDAASDELLREIIQRKTTFIKQLEEVTRTDMEVSMQDVSVEVSEGVGLRGNSASLMHMRHARTHCFAHSAVVLVHAHCSL